MSLALASLLDHANREDTDVFPVALQVLPDSAWERVQALSRQRTGLSQARPP